MRQHPFASTLHWRSASLVTAMALLCQFSTHGFAQGSLGKAKQLRDQGKLVEAEKELHEYLKFSPNDAAAYVVLGKCQMERENRLGAEKSFRKALELNPNVSGAADAKMMLKQIEDYFAKPAKPPMAPKRAPEVKQETSKAKTVEAGGGGIVGPVDPSTVTTYGKPGKGAGGKRMLGAALEGGGAGSEETGGQAAGMNLPVLIAVIAVVALALGGLIAFLVLRKRESDELVI